MKRIYPSLLIFPVMVLVFDILPVVRDTMAQQPTSGESEMKANIEEWSPAQKDLWKFEETYWKYLQDGNVDSLGVFWHKKFVGWPSHAAEPVDLSGTRSSLEDLQKSVKIISYDLKPQVIMIYGKIAIVHYLAVLISENKEGEQRTNPYRITHTWLNEDGKWSILGGMSAE